MSSDLQLTFSEVYKKISEFLGLGSSPTGTNLIKVKDLAYRGYVRFLLPTYLRDGRLHVWSFLKQDKYIDTVSGVWEYDLPSEFQYFSYGPNYNENENYPPPQPTTIRRIMTLRAVNSTSAYPQYWSLNTAKYSVESGSILSMVFHPTPTQVFRLNYGCVIEPNKPTDDAHYFIGGALCSHAILECGLAEAEAQDDEVLGIHHQRAEALTMKCIEADLKRAPRDVGVVRDGRMYYNDPVLARELRWVGSATGAYGVDITS